MQAFTVHSAEFIKGVRSLKDLPGGKIPEFAFAGRSNVGKSTLINRLCQRKELARTGSKPGRTRELNFYRINLSGAHLKNFALHLVDLPGFGYASFSKQQRESISRLIVKYCTTGNNLRALILLIDSKRKPEDDELALYELCLSNNIPVIAVATKMDRLKQSERAKALKVISGPLGLMPEDILHSGNKTPLMKIWARIAAYID
ncbi:MAG: ribosome biogenesis GTP-binding protein YsxC [Candidatus Dadabacteria bacterium]|nr:MAG: ribosome biogenesis GTP-binding protein YsxC [Candidatus Dadabacteria bacterium]